MGAKRKEKDGSKVSDGIDTSIFLNNKGKLTIAVVVLVSNLCDRI